MPTRNVYLTAALDTAVQNRVDSGQYESVSEVVRAALRALERVEREESAKLSALERALEEGAQSPDFIGDPFEAAYAQIGWRPIGSRPIAKKGRRRRG